MQRFTFYLCLLLGWLLTACADGLDVHTRAALARADSLLEVQPDSTLHLLQSLSPQAWKNRDGQMYHALLMAHLKRSKGIQLVDDSLLKELAAYYETQGNDSLQARACLLLGHYYQSASEPGQAFSAYYRTTALLRQVGDSRFLGEAYNCLARIYRTHKMDAQADSLYRELESLARQTGDSTRLAEALLRQGDYALSFRREKDYPKAERLIREGYKMVLRRHDYANYSLAYGTMASYYHHTHQYDEALKVAKEYIRAASPQDGWNWPRACAGLGKTYASLGQDDSASVWLHKALDTPDYAVKKDVYFCLARMAENNGEYEQALHWKDLQNSCQFELDAKLQPAEVTLAVREAALDNARRARETSGPTAATYAWIAALLCMVVATGIALLRRRHSRLNDRQAAWQQQVLRQGMCRTNVYSRILAILDYYKQYADYESHWTAADMQAFFQEVDALWPGYRLALMERYPKLTAEDVFLCLLYLLGFKDRQIGILLERNKSTIIRKRQTMLQDKMGKKQTQTENLLKICLLSTQVQ